MRNFDNWHKSKSNLSKEEWVTGKIKRVSIHCRRKIDKSMSKLNVKVTNVAQKLMKLVVHELVPLYPKSSDWVTFVFFLDSSGYHYELKIVSQI